MSEPTDPIDTLEPAELAVLVLGRLRHGARTRPSLTLAAVFGVGVVLGRGLPAFVVRLGSAFALRALAGRVLVRSLTASGHEPTRRRDASSGASA